MHGSLMGEPRARGWLVEGWYKDLLGKKVGVPAFAGDRCETICDFEEVEELVPLEFFERENVASGKAANKCPPGIGLRLLVILYYNMMTLRQPSPIR